MKRNAKNKVDKKSNHRTICDSRFIFGFTVFCLSLIHILDAYLSYFCEERVSLLDYLKKEDSIVFLDETVRTIERGQSTDCLLYTSRCV